MTTHYGDDRHWVAIDICPACDADHPEFEFKRGEDGKYTGRCYRGKMVIELDPETGVVMAVDHALGAG